MQDTTEGHNFILDWEVPKASSGDFLVREVTTKQNHKCKLFCNIIKEDKIEYKALVTYKEETDYVNLSRLPVQMTYMAYYLQETVKVRMKEGEDKLDHVGLEMIDVEQFKVKMKELYQSKLGVSNSEQPKP